MNEKKFYDSTLSAQTMNTAWQNIDFLHGITQPAIGTGTTTANTRVGNKIIVHSIEFIITCYATAAISGAGATCRFALVHNKETNGAVITAADVWQGNGYDSLRATATQPKYSVLRDEYHSMLGTANNAGTMVAFGPTKLMRWKVYPRKQIDFISSTGAIADVLKDNYTLMHVANNATGCQFNLHLKVVFSDA